MGILFPWATPEHLLKKMTLGQLFFFYRKGMEFDLERVKLQANLTGAAANGIIIPDEEPPEEKQPETPDKKALYSMLGGNKNANIRRTT